MDMEISTKVLDNIPSEKAQEIFELEKKKIDLEKKRAILASRKQIFNEISQKEKLELEEAKKQEEEISRKKLELEERKKGGKILSN